MPITWPHLWKSYIFCFLKIHEVYKSTQKRYEWDTNGSGGQSRGGGNGMGLSEAFVDLQTSVVLENCVVRKCVQGFFPCALKDNNLKQSSDISTGLRFLFFFHQSSIAPGPFRSLECCCL